MRLRLWAVVVAVFVPVWVVSGTGCLHDGRAARSHAQQSPFDREVSRVPAPLKNRCELHGGSSVRSSCDDARYLGQNYVRRLSVGDEVCIEGGFGELPTAACLARAAVVDVGENTVLLEVRDAQPNSRWYKHVMGQVWYEEGALVDLYLADRGY